MRVGVPVHEDREDARPPEAGGGELPAVELRDPEGEVGDPGQPLELPAPAPAAVGHARVHPHPVLRRRDVVVDHDLPVGEPGEEARHLRADGAVEEDDVGGGGHVAVARVEAGVRLEGVVDVLAVHVRGVAPAAEEPPEGADVIADGVPEVEVGNELVDGGQSRDHPRRAPRLRRSSR